jgi:hypothetical protein
MRTTHPHRRYYESILKKIQGENDDSYELLGMSYESVQVERSGFIKALQLAGLITNNS